MKFIKLLLNISRNLVSKALVFYLVFSTAFSPTFGLLQFVKAEVVSGYNFNISNLVIPPTVQPDEVLNLPVTLENIDSNIWYKDIVSGTPILKIGYLLNGLLADTKTELVSDVSDITLSPNNFTDLSETINIISPATTGDYTVEVVLFDETNNTYYEASAANKQIFNLKVEIPLTPDISLPSGSIEINSGATETTNSIINIKLNATDPVVDGAVNSGVTGYKILMGNESWVLSAEEIATRFNTTNWEIFTGNELTISRDITGLIAQNSQPITAYVKFQDGATNESEIYSASINFLSTAPTGGLQVDQTELVDVEGTLQAQTNQVKLNLNANSNVAVDAYKLVMSNELWAMSSSELQNTLNNTQWINFPDTTQNSQLITQNLDLPDVTNNYYFYVQYKNIFGQVSEIYSSSVYYQKYNITPELTLSANDVLFAGNMELSAELKNLGSDIGYNARFEIVLPTGFTFVEPLEYKEGQYKLSMGGTAPTFISTNAEGKQILVYEGIDDLLTGESTSVHAKIKVGGMNEGYKLGDLVDISAKGQLFKRSNFRTGFETSSNIQVELKPFIVSSDSAEDNNSDGVSEELVEEVIDNAVTIQINPEVGAASPQPSPNGEGVAVSPVVVEFELENGQSYIADSQNVFINGIQATIVFEIVETINSNPVLRWMFGEVDANDVIEIFFQTKVDKIEDQDISGINFVDHDQELINNLNVEGIFDVPDVDGVKQEDCLAVNVETQNLASLQQVTEGCEPKILTESEQNSVIAKYFKINKSATPEETAAPVSSQDVDINTVIRYTIKIETSKEYDLSGIEITDVLPDGVTFDNDNANILGTNIFLHNFEKDLITGETILIWRINSAEGIPAGTVYEFSYDVNVNSNYDVKQLTDGDSRLLSRDYLISKVTVRGLWTDIDDSYIREETLEERIETDTDYAGNRMHVVNFEDGIKLASPQPSPNGEGVFADSVNAKIGDIFDIYAYVTFPQNIPTNDFNYRTYLPVGTTLVEDSLVVTPTGIFSKDPTISQKIEGGYLFEAGKVEPGATFRIDYQIQVQDDANLKEAVVVRNLFRADYKNIDNNKFTYRNDVTLNLIEPRLEISKNLVSGYLARGEEATIQVKIRNVGTDSAFGINISDTIPTNTTLIANSYQLAVTSNLGNVFQVIYDGNTNEFKIENFDLQKGEEILIEYKVITDPDTIFGGNIDSVITVSQYSNRPEEDILPERNYLGGEYEYNWNASEPLIVTDVETHNAVETQNLASLPVYRNEEFGLEAIVKPVGNAPVYDNTVIVDLNSVSDLTSNINAIPYKVFINNVEQPFDFAQGDIMGEGRYRFEGIDLGANDILKIAFELQVPKFAEFGKEYPVILEVVGKDKLGNGVRKDGSNENIKDIDNDDKSESNIIVAKRNINAPTGSISFIVDDIQATTTNKDNVDSLKYTIQSDSEIAGIRFSNDGTNWYTNPDINLLNEETKTLLEISGDWNELPFDSAQGDNNQLFDNCISNLTNCQLNIEGRNYKYFQVVDLQNNLAIISSSILKDTVAPESPFLSLSPFQNDFSNPALTGITQNYLNFTAEDDCETEVLSFECSGIGSYSYSIDNITWSEWVSTAVGENTIQLSYPTIEAGEKYYAYLKIKDLAGNISVRQSSAIDPITQEELDNTIYFDSIVFDDTTPAISIDLNDGDTYTSDPYVNLGLEIINGDYGIVQIRYSNILEDFDANAVWFDYIPNENIKRTLYDFNTDGEKQLCVQVKNSLAAVSNIKCDSILLDTTAPMGFMIINNGEFDTENRDVTLNIAATDPNLADNNLGIWQIKIQFSETGEDCRLYTNANEISECESKWSTWLALGESAMGGEDYKSAKPWTLKESIGEQTIYFRFKDGLDNISEVNNSKISYNPIKGTGNIVINNNDIFTNTRDVNMDLSVDMSEFACSSCTRPVLMRFYQHNGRDLSFTPENIAVDANVDNLKGWTAWNEYPTGNNIFAGIPQNFNKQWDLDGANRGYPNYGYKTIFVQYLLPNATPTDVYHDTIIYAPFYGVEYTANNTDIDNTNKIYTINNIPSQFKAQEEFNIKLNAKNIGSFTWPAQDSDNPVRITYKWKRVGGAIPEGWTESLIPKEVRGNSVILPKDVMYDEQILNLNLKVNTPIFPGEYELIIDTVHEGKAWFSDFGNSTLNYNISISDNPEKPLPVPEFGTTLGANDAIGGPVPVPYEYESSGWGTNCEDTWSSNNYSGRTCYIQGRWQPPRDTSYHSICQNINGGYYEYEIQTDQNRVFFFCPGDTGYWDQHLGSQVTAKVYWFTDSKGFKILKLFPGRKTWDSRYEANRNDSKLQSLIKVNRSTPSSEYKFTIQPKFTNVGTAIWTNSNVELVALSKAYSQGGVEVPSPFYDSATWKNSSRIKVDVNHSGYGQWSLAPFTFNIRVPETMPYGIYKQCFVMTNMPYENWEVRQDFCITMDIQMTYQEQRQYFCPQPHPVYIPDDSVDTQNVASLQAWLNNIPVNSTLIGNLNQNDSFIIKGQESGWLLIYFASGEHQEGWIKDNLACFGAAVTINNIIPEPTFEVIPPPTGDTGVVIRTDGVIIRKGPDERFTEVTKINYGDKVQVLAEAYIPDNKYGGWLYVRLDVSKCKPEDLILDQSTGIKNCEGWVPKGTIHHVNDPKDVQISLIPDMVRVHVCGGNDIPVYAAPGVKSITVGSISEDQNVSIIMKWTPPIPNAGPWFQIYLNKNGDTGWIENLNGLCEGFTFPKGKIYCGGALGYPYDQFYGVSNNGDFNDRGGTHKAIDIPAPYGKEILASDYGVVVSSFVTNDCTSNNPHPIYGVNWYRGGAQLIKIYYPSQNVTAMYLHLSERKVSKGDEVFPGMIIGRTGNTGCVSPMPNASNPTGGTHLHLEMFDHGQGTKVDPKQVMSGGVNSCYEEEGGGSVAGHDRYVNNLAGTPEDFYGTKNQSNLGTPRIRLKVTNDGGSIKSELVSGNMPSPEITYIDVNEENTQATIYGVALNKNVNTLFQIDYFERSDCKFGLPILGCLDWNYRYNLVEFHDGLDHAGLSFYKDVLTLPLSFGWLWNDSQDGRFTFTFNLNDEDNKNVILGDKVFARSQMWLDPIKFGVNGTEVTVNIGESLQPWYEKDIYQRLGFISGKSNVEEVRDTHIEILKAKLKKDFSISAIDGDANWTEHELQLMLEVFNSVGKSFYNDTLLTEIRRDRVYNRGGDCSNSGGVVVPGVLGVYKNTCKSFSVFDEASGQIITKYGSVTEDESFKINAVHEITHAFQRKDPSKSIEYAEISWQNINTDGRSSDRQANVTNCDFVTGYLLNSWEDMAEAYGVHFGRSSSAASFREEYELVKNLQTSKVVFGGDTPLPPLNACPRIPIVPRPEIPPFDRAVEYNQTQLNIKELFNY